MISAVLAAHLRIPDSPAPASAAKPALRLRQGEIGATGVTSASTSLLTSALQGDGGGQVEGEAGSGEEAVEGSC